MPPRPRRARRGGGAGVRDDKTPDSVHAGTASGVSSRVAGPATAQRC
ncbi:hypothetical protein FM106_27515 [Brachybacterium faecium]|nr:hypothetical protein FM106_27515 [Brachybacterium faecium]